MIPHDLAAPSRLPFVGLRARRAFCFAVVFQSVCLLVLLAVDMFPHVVAGCFPLQGSW